MQVRLFFIEQNPIDIRVSHVPRANLNHRQAGAAKEGKSPVAGDTITNRDARQASAVFEGIYPDADDAIRDCDAREVGGGLEGGIPHTGDRFSFNFSGDNQISQCLFIAASDSDCITFDLIF